MRSGKAFVRSWTAALLMLFVSSGCTTFAPAPHVAHEPMAAPEEPLPGVPVALVLSGGAARGFAHVGVLKVLEKEGLKPDIVVGCSSGSIVGALYASGRSAAQVDEALAEMSLSVFRDVVLPGMGVWPGELGFIKGERLRVFIRDRLLHEEIEEFPIRFAAVATDLQSGNVVAFNRGDASLAVRASSAVPGVLTPAQVHGRYYGDGQIASPLPVAVARSLGAKIVIAVDVIYPPEDALLYSVPAVLFQAFTIGTNRLRDYEAREADVLIKPAIGPTSGQLGLSARTALIEAGEIAARQALPRIKQVMRQYQ